MAAYPYVTVPGHLQKFMKHIQKAGVPDKVTLKYLKQSGFTSSNDRKIRDVLKFIGFLDGNYVPTDKWRHYRDKRKAGTVLARALKDGYSELYHTFSDAHRKDNEALTNFFRAHTEVGERALSGMVSSFNALADLADFSTLDEGEPATPEVGLKAGEAGTPPATQVTTATRSAGDGLTVNVNIEIGVPATDDPEVYEKFFEAMKKHLLSD